VSDPSRICITPVTDKITAAAVLFGVVAGIGCNWSSDLFYWMGIDDALDVCNPVDLNLRSSSF
jgi:ammonia channel protein AmtB